MNCPEVQERVQRWLDGESELGLASLETHLSSCLSCRELVQAAQRLAWGLRLRAPLPLVGLAERITSRILQEQRSRRWRRRVVVGLALAASVLAAVFLGRFLGRPTPPEPVPEERVVQQETPPPPIGQEVHEVQLALGALVRRAADETVDQGRLLLPNQILPSTPLAPDSWQISLDEPARTLAQTGQSLSASLEPVTGSARRAMDLFLRELSPVETELKPDL